MWPFKKRKKRKPVLRYRIRVDDWLYYTEDGTLSWDIHKAKEFNTLREAYDIVIPCSEVMYIENKDGRVRYIHTERVYNEIGNS